MRRQRTHVEAGLGSPSLGSREWERPPNSHRSRLVGKHCWARKMHSSGVREVRRGVGVGTVSSTLAIFRIKRMTTRSVWSKIPVPVRTQFKSSSVRRAAAVLALWTASSACSSNRPATASESVKPFKVLETTKRVATRLVILRSETGTIVTTPEHPFARRGGGWTPAAKLSAGDRIESQSSTGGVMILGTEIREVAPTPVYNLTVASTHAYFVGLPGLLVHNVDCRAQELREKQARLRLRAEREAVRKEAAERERKRRLIVNDRPADPNCAFCTLTGLSDKDKVSNFHQSTGLSMWDREGRALLPTPRELEKMLKKLRMTSRKTPRPKEFPERNSELKRSEKSASTEHPRPTFPYGEQSIEFMQHSSANTFAVSYFYWNGTERKAHSLLAVKHVDGSIVYLDLQETPPITYEHLDPHFYRVRATPTDVDWRFNRLLYGNIVERTPIVHRHAYVGPE